MAITSPDKYQRLMGADQHRIFAILADEVGMKKAREIAKRVLSDEPMPDVAELFMRF